MKAKAIIFHSDFTGELKTVWVKNGTVRVDDKEFFVEKNEPFVIKTGLGSGKPFYLLHYNSLYPAGFESIREEIKYKKTDDEGKNILSYINFVKVLRKNGYKEKVVPKNDFVLKTLKPLQPEFYKKGYSPQLLSNTTDLRFLKQMKQYVTPGKKMGMLPVILAFVFGAGWILLILIITGMIPLG
jgi:hypothetical protein